MSDMKREEAKDCLRKAISIMAESPFVKEYIREDNLADRKREGLGILIAGHEEWDGVGIMQIFYSALEDANFHKEAGEVQKWIEAYDPTCEACGSGQKECNCLGPSSSEVKP